MVFSLLMPNGTENYKLTAQNELLIDVSRTYSTKGKQKHEKLVNVRAIVSRGRPQNIDKPTTSRQSKVVHR
jgi:hypothetical protein